MTIDPTINLGNLLTALAMLVAFIGWAVVAGGDFKVLKQKVGEISDKLDTFISKELVDEKLKSLQRQIDELRET